MTRLDNRPPTTTDGHTRPTWWPWAAGGLGVLVVALLVGLPLFLINRGSDVETEPLTTTTLGTTVTTTAVTTTVPTDETPVTTTLPVFAPVPVDVTLYFMADYVQNSNVAGPHLVPVRRTVDVLAESVTITDTLGAALEAVIEGPSRNDAALYPAISSSVPRDTRLLGYSIDPASGGIATIDLSAEFEAGGGTFAMTSRLAQIVYTATQFADVDKVIFFVEGEQVSVFSGEGIVLTGPQTRDDFRFVLPLIFAESPLAGMTVSSPVRIKGISNTFEATMQYSLETAEGTVLAKGFTTATCGTGCWGTFDFTAEYALAEKTPGYILLFEGSARDGRPINIVRIPVTLNAAKASTEGLYIDVYGDVPGGPRLDGAIVTVPSVTISGYTNAATTVTVNGQFVGTENSGFETIVALTPGVNQVKVVAGVIESVYTITYLPDATVEFAYLSAVSASELVADYAQWLTGDEANAAAREDGEIGADETVPNDYYIRNLEPDVLGLLIADDVVIWLPTPAFGSVDSVKVTLTEWLALFDEEGAPWAPEDQPEYVEPHFGYFGAGLREFAYWLTIDADGTVVQIVGQYRP